jgi:hypothetical protein
LQGHTDGGIAVHVGSDIKDLFDESVLVIIHVNMETSQGNSCVAIFNKQNIFFLLQNWRTGTQNRSCLRDTGTSGRGQEVGKRCRRMNTVKYFVHMYVNGKMISAENIP